MSLGLGNPPSTHTKRPAPAREIVERPVVLWVGITDQALDGVRESLPVYTRTLLDCCDQGFKHMVPVTNGPAIDFRRIRYRGRPIGYGTVISEWMTLKPNAEIPVGFMKDEKIYALRVLRALGLGAHSHLTDRV